MGNPVKGKQKNNQMKKQQRSHSQHLHMDMHLLTQSANTHTKVSGKFEIEAKCVQSGFTLTHE